MTVTGVLQTATRCSFVYHIAYSTLNTEDSECYHQTPAFLRFSTRQEGQRYVNTQRTKTDSQQGQLLWRRPCPMTIVTWFVFQFCDLVVISWVLFLHFISKEWAFSIVLAPDCCPLKSTFRAQGHWAFGTVWPPGDSHSNRQLVGIMIIAITAFLPKSPVIWEGPV